MKYSMEEKQKYVKQFADLCLNFFAAINEIAFAEFLHVHRKLIQKPIYRYELKKHTKDCLKALQRIVEAPEEYIKEDAKDLYYKIADNCEDDMRINIEDMRKEAANYFRKHGVVDYEFFADAEIARITIHEASLAFNQMAAEMSAKSGENMKSLYRNFDPEPAKNRVSDVVRLIFNTYPKQVNLNECKPLLRAYRRFHAKYANSHFLRRSIRKALKDEGNKE